jgi:hypothetical protein
VIWQAFFLFFAASPTETAESIMAKVAAAQDRAEEARTTVVYHSNVLIRFNRSNGKLAREEQSEYIVTPTATGSKKERTSFLGKYTEHGRVIEYRQPTVNPHVRVDIDGEAITDLAEELADDRKTKDGIARDLFPLTSKQQRHYRFQLEGTEQYQGIPVYRITFEPKPDQDAAWAGEALVHQTEFQPVLVTTHLPFKIPFVVRTVLGTNIEHLGFKVRYKEFDQGLWFPVTYGGEFKLRALFFYARRIGISIQNDGFRRTNVNSTVKFATVE